MCQKTTQVSIYPCGNMLTRSLFFQCDKGPCDYTDIVNQITTVYPIEFCWKCGGNAGAENCRSVSESEGEVDSEIEIGFLHVLDLFGSGEDDGGGDEGEESEEEEDGKEEGDGGGEKGEDGRDESLWEDDKDDADDEDEGYGSGRH